MRRIPDSLLKSVVFVYPTLEDAVQGKGYGGSGFVVAVTESAEVDKARYDEDPLGDPAHVYVVTNAHVAADCSFVRTSAPHQPIVRIDAWTNHPEGDDVAIAHLGILGITPMALGKVMHHSVLITPESFVENQVGPGDQLFMTGRFTGLDERERSEATVRAGILSMASTISVENSRWGNVMQESFFAEVNSKAGYSGSPVFVDIPIEIPPVKRVIMHPPRPQFLGCLGMTWGLWRSYVELLDPDTHKPVPEGWVIHENSGIELVVPAWRILALLQEDTVVKHREQFAENARRKIKSLKPDAVATNAEPVPDSPTLTRGEFENALRKVSRRKPSQPDE